MNYFKDSTAKKEMKVEAKARQAEKQILTNMSGTRRKGVLHHSGKDFMRDAAEGHTGSSHSLISVGSAQQQQQDAEPGAAVTKARGGSVSHELGAEQVEEEAAEETAAEEDDDDAGAGSIGDGRRSGSGGGCRGQGFFAQLTSGAALRSCCPRQRTRLRRQPSHINQGLNKLASTANVRRRVRMLVLVLASTRVATQQHQHDERVPRASERR